MSGRMDRLHLQRELAVDQVGLAHRHELVEAIRVAGGDVLVEVQPRRTHPPRTRKHRPEEGAVERFDRGELPRARRHLRWREGGHWGKGKGARRRGGRKARACAHACQRKMCCSGRAYASPHTA